MKIPLDKIKVDHSLNVSRKATPVTAEGCEGLARTIEQYGMFTPVCVKPIEHDAVYDYQLVCGYRRYVAHTILGRDEIECFVREEDCNADQARKLNVLENLQRDNPEYWDQCCALREAYDPDTGDTQIAKELGKSRSWVRARWLVWRLPPDVIAQVEAGLLSVSHVTMLIHKSPEEQQAAAARILKGIEAGETKQQLEGDLTRRRSVRVKKELQAMMTKLMETERMDLVNTLRWAAGEISETQLMELIN